jgi:hypothetical protein
MDEKLFAACQYTAHSLDWRGAIKLACRPLAQQGKSAPAMRMPSSALPRKMAPGTYSLRNLPSRTPARMKGF